MRAALLGLILAEACSPEPFVTGEREARHGLRRTDGERVGQAELFAVPEAEGTVERIELDLNGMRIDMEASTTVTDQGWAYRNRLAQAGVVSWTEADHEGWSERSGATIHERALALPPTALHIGRASATGGGWALGLSHWDPVLPVIAATPTGESRTLDSVNLSSGRAEPL